MNRRQIWLEILKPTPVHDQECKVSPEVSRQIELDINRGQLILNISDIRPHRKQRLKQKVSNLIKQVLYRNPLLNYYQGYHDAVSVLVLLYDGSIDDTLLSGLVERFTLMFLRDNMLADMNSCNCYLDLVTAVIKLEDPVLYEFMQSASSQRDEWFRYWSLSWLLTWMAHLLSKEEQWHLLVRLWDFFISTADGEVYFVPAVCFFAAQMALEKKAQLLSLDEVDEATVQGLLQKFPKYLATDTQTDEEVLEQLIQKTDHLVKKYSYLLQDFPRQSAVQTFDASDSIEQLRVKLERALNAQQQDLEEKQRLIDEEVYFKEAQMLAKLRERERLKTLALSVAVTILAIVWYKFTG